MRIRPVRFTLALAAGVLSATAAQAGNGKLVAASELYAAPRESAQPIAALSAGSVLVIYGCDAKFDWCDVRAGDARGWVSSKDLSVIRAGNFVPIRDVAPFAGVRVVEYDRDEYSARHYAGTPQAQTKQQAEPATAMTQPSAPAAADPAYSQAVSAVAKALTAQPAEPRTQARPNAASEWVGEAISDSSIRSGPGMRYPRIATIRFGEEIVIHGCTAGYRWCDIAAKGARGWVYGPLLAVASGNDLGPLPNQGNEAGVAIVKFDMQDYHRQYYQGEPWQNRTNNNTARQTDDAQNGEAETTAARVVRLPDRRGRASLPADANALQATPNDETQYAPATGLRRLLSGVFR